MGEFGDLLYPSAADLADILKERTEDWSYLLKKFAVGFDLEPLRPTMYQSSNPALIREWLSWSFFMEDRIV